MLRSASGMKRNAGLPITMVLGLVGGCTTEPDGLLDFGGDGKADGASAVLPSCVTPGSLFARVFDAARPVVDRGDVPAAYFASQRNHANRDMLLRGPEIFPRMRELIAQAQHEVDLQFYVWENDSDPARHIFDGLKDLEAKVRAEGRDAVTVRIIVDAFNEGSPFAFPGAYRITKLMPAVASGVDALGLDPTYVHWQLAAYTHNGLGNLHSKVLVVDGHDAVIGGANVEAVHNDKDPWNDSGYQVEGDVAVSLLAEFDNAWRTSHEWTCGSAGGSQADCTRDPAPVKHAVVDNALAEATCEPIMVVTRKGDPNPLGNRTDNTQDQAFLAAFAGATHHLHMMTPNLNDDAAKDAIVAAVRRGVTVDIILSDGFNDSGVSLPGQGGTNVDNVNELYTKTLADLPDRCDRLRVRWYAADDGQLMIGNGPRASHAKYTSVDDELVIVGGANMDTQAWNHSRETNIAVGSAEVTRAWDAKMFGPAFQRGWLPGECQ
jgi:phosphatidylserine/phosphatidylglycerophosphate/cardiolipin synthase-like enzyme